MRAADGRGRGRLAGVALAIVAPLLAFVALMSWGLSSPVGSSPDDDFHLASIWCAAGDEARTCEPSPTAENREISEKLLRSHVCFAFYPDASAACQPGDLSDVQAPLIDSERGNFAGLYPPVFYGTMSLFAGDNLETSVLVIRAVNSLLMVGLMTAVVVVAPRRLRMPAVLGVVGTAVPLAVFIIPSTNPSSWAIISAATLWPALMTWYASTGWRRVTSGVLATLAVFMGGGARADAALFAVLAMVAVAILSAERSKRFLLSSILPVALTVVSGLFFLSGRQGSQVGSGLPNADGDQRGLRFLIGENLQQVPSLFAGIFGNGSNLGWLDTPVPAATWVLGLSIFFALGFVGIGVVDTRKTVVVAAAFAALWLVPTVLLVQTRALAGSQVQPRYVLPIAVILLGLTLVATRAGRPRLGRGQMVFVIAGLSLANALALHGNMRRYITGLDVDGWNLDSGLEWWWPAAPSPSLVWVAGSAAFTLCLVALAAVLERSAERDLPGSPDVRGHGRVEAVDQDDEWTRPAVNAV